MLRLVARGTIEELKYCRQVYKVHLKKQTLEDEEYTNVQPARLFRGVAADPNRKGELFGSENLLKFKDGSFVDDLWKASEANGSRNQIDEHQLAALMEGKDELIENGFVDEDEEIVDMVVEQISGMKEINHEDFLREDRGAPVTNAGDEGIDEVLGSSQFNFMAGASVEEMIAESKEEEDLIKEVEQSLIDDSQSIHNKRVKNQQNQENSITRVAIRTKSPLRKERLQSDLNKSINGGKKYTKAARKSKSLFKSEITRKESSFSSSTILYRPSYLDSTGKVKR